MTKLHALHPQAGEQISHIASHPQHPVTLCTRCSKACFFLQAPLLTLLPLRSVVGMPTLLSMSLPQERPSDSKIVSSLPVLLLALVNLAPRGSTVLSI